MSDQEKMHSAKRKTKPITSHFTKIARSGQTSYEDEDASSEIEAAGEVHAQDDPQLRLRTSSEATSFSLLATLETTCEFDFGLYDPALRPARQKYEYLTRYWSPPQGTASFCDFALWRHTSEKLNQGRKAKRPRSAACASRQVPSNKIIDDFAQMKAGRLKVAL